MRKILNKLFASKIIHNCEGEPYLLRWYVIRKESFAVFVHQFVRSDEDRALHDHPWDFIVIPLWRGYIEHSEKVTTHGTPFIISKRVWPIFGISMRPATYKHRVELVKGKPAWSLFIRFKKRRLWGFWPKGGFIDWKQWWNSHCEDMFKTRLLTDEQIASIESGFGAGGVIDPDRWAEQMGIEPISGGWLCAYMIRRFGWPNIGSDDYKQLCTWVLTTPVSGFFLGVTPYLAETSFMHFSVYFTEAVQPKLYEDPQADAVRAEAEQVAKEWWESTGKDRYVLGTTKDQEDADRLALYISESEDGVCGFYERAPDEPPQDFPTENVNWAAWLIRELIRERHPDEVTFPKHELGPRQPTPFQIECKKAVQTVVKDLLRPTYVRDVYFTPHGNADPDQESGTAEPFEHAGCTPKYLYQI